MKLHQDICLISTVFLLFISAACSFPNPENRAVSPTDVNQKKQTETQKPSTKTTNIIIEGESTTISLELYSHPLFTTYFPTSDFIPESVSSGEGSSVRFYANFGGTKNEAAYVQFFFPAYTHTINQLKQTWIEGENGLLASNGWRITEVVQKTAYPWAKEKINYYQPENNIVGTVYVGESEGSVFYVVTHYPAEYGDGFMPRANLILQNLDINSVNLSYNYR